MSFEFDAEKAAANLEKHRLELALGRGIFDGNFIEGVDGRFDYGETRFIAIGPVESLGGRICVTVYTWRDGARRLISFRKANEDEIRKYRRHHR